MDAGRSSPAKTTGDDLRALKERARRHHSEGALLRALHDYDRVIALGGADPLVWREMGDALCGVGEYAQALGAYVHASPLGDAETHYQTGRAHYRLGLIGEAVRHLRASVERCESIQPWLALATILPGSPDATPAQILAARRRFAERLLQTAPDECLRAGPTSTPRRARSRVGYVCAFFDRPNYMKPVWGVLNAHDRGTVEIHLFGDRRPGTAAEGYRGDPDDTFHDTAGLDVAELATMIDEARLDVLVDLNGYSAPERLPILAGRRAPLNVAWFAMYGTTGLPGIDVIVADDIAIGPGEDELYSERVVRLPLSYLAFQPDPRAPAPGAPGAGERFVFGSLAPQYKLTELMIETWADILRRAPSGDLLLANTTLASRENRAHLIDRFEARGIAADRLRLREPADHLDFLRYYDEMDVSLDTVPYNGGTTTMESLWQGVPVLTTRGDRWAARISAGLLRSAGLEQYVFDDLTGLADAAVALAEHPPDRSALAEARTGLRAGVEVSPACDSRALAGALESVYLGGRA